VVPGGRGGDCNSYMRWGHCVVVKYVGVTCAGVNAYCRICRGCMHRGHCVVVEYVTYRGHMCKSQRVMVGHVGVQLVGLATC